MSRFTSISALADEVLEAVVREARAKTAAVTEDKPRYQIPIAEELRKVAASLREGPDEADVTPEDLAALGNDPEVDELLALLQENPELLAALMEQEGLDVPDAYEIDTDTDDAAIAVPPAPPDAMDLEEKSASASLDLRKLAESLRVDSKQQKAARLIKAAHVLNAATGIQHLIGSKKCV